MRRHGIGRQLQRSQSGSTPHDRITIPQICSSRSPALNRPRQSALRYPALVSNHPPIHSLRRHPPLNHEPLHRRPTCCNRIGSSHTPHPRHSNPHSARRTTHLSLPAVSLYGAFFVKEFRQSVKSFVLRQFLCSISKPVSSSRPAASLTSSRAGAVKVGRRTNPFRQAPPLPGHTLTASSTTARLVRSG